MASRRNPKSVRAKTCGPFTMDELFRPPRPQSRSGPQCKHAPRTNQQPKSKPKINNQQSTQNVQRTKQRMTTGAEFTVGKKANGRALNSNKFDYVADLNRGVEPHPDVDRTPVRRDAANCCATQFCCTIM